MEASRSDHATSRHFTLLFVMKCNLVVYTVIAHSNGLYFKGTYVVIIVYNWSIITTLLFYVQSTYNVTNTTPYCLTYSIMQMRWKKIISLTIFSHVTAKYNYIEFAYRITESKIWLVSFNSLWNQTKQLLNLFKYLFFYIS